MKWICSVVHPLLSKLLLQKFSWRRTVHGMAYLGDQNSFWSYLCLIIFAISLYVSWVLIFHESEEIIISIAFCCRKIYSTQCRKIYHPPRGCVLCFSSNNNYVGTYLLWWNFEQGTLASRNFSVTIQRMMKNKYLSIHSAPEQSYLILSSFSLKLEKNANQV